MAYQQSYWMCFGETDDAGRVCLQAMLLQCCERDISGMVTVRKAHLAKATC